ncbi:carbohydrate binding domain-containing protein [Labilibacter marinus]|uniref:carbohydrate binding domain-containing protein n=1 Tax=Labilibacter marinus TaxID=1477105 RepID=UPI0009FA4809|nr:carbohydrate binding domain-containing protein [Labilibacter marinus]
MKKQLLLLLMLILAFNSYANPPKPPIGKRWVLNLDYSDEFNGTELDLAKWYDYHPTWKGREPGLFMPSQIKVENGYLAIHGEKMAKDTVVNGSIFNIKCGAVISRKRTAHYGYYECKFKANKTTLSTTFWFSTRANFDGPEECDDKYSQEWDIQECIGRGGDFQGSWFAKGMHCNAHYWYNDCDGERHDYRATEVRYEDDKLSSEDFDIYGGWWRDSKTATYYYNNQDPKNQTFYNEISSTPFSQPMGMNLVVETYPFPWIELPNDEELADPEKNTSYYDWVRAYTLVDAFEPLETEEEAPIVENGDFETGDLSNWVGWGSPGAAITDDATHVANGSYACYIVGGGAPEYNMDLKPNTDYTLKCNAKATSGSLSLGIKENTSGVSIKSIEVSGDAYQEYTLQFNSGINSSLKLYYFAQAGESGYIDDVIVTEDNPVPPVKPDPIEIYDESVHLSSNFSQDWDRQIISVPLQFQANEDREIHLKLKNMDDVVVADTILNGYAGYANAVVELQIDSVLNKAAFSLYTDIRTVDGTESDIIHTESVTLTNVSVKNPNAEILQVYPSPTTSELFINGVQPGLRYTIFDMQGRIVDSNVYTNQAISVSQLRAGIYIIQIDERKARFVKK